MTNIIEETNKQWHKYFWRYLVGLFLFMILMAVRFLFGYIFREYDLNSQPIGRAVLIGLITLLIVQVYYLFKLARIKKAMRDNPQLKDALNNELTQLYEIKSWKPAFIGAIATPYVFLLISSFHPFSDLLLVAFTTSVVGIGAYLTSLYLMSRE